MSITKRNRDRAKYIKTGITGRLLCSPTYIVNDGVRDNFDLSSNITEINTNFAVPTPAVTDKRLVTVDVDKTPLLQIALSPGYHPSIQMEPLVIEC
ncbi:MAG: hypothetical protein KAH64_01940 [Nitrosomonadaceae bacterium]|nr:hypothetical protein [Nitrosomonadaceae bacterium]